MMYSEEEQKEIEAEFIASWNEMEIFFGEDDLPWMTQMLTLIRLLRSRSYDRHLRADHSLIMFIVSRSQEYGLRRGQPSLSFEITAQGGMVAHLIGDHVNVVVTTDRVEITPEIENLLIPLLSYPIN